MTLMIQLVHTEAFVVCQNYSPPPGYIPNMSNPLLDHHYGTIYGFIKLKKKALHAYNLTYVTF